MHEPVDPGIPASMPPRPLGLAARVIKVFAASPEAFTRPLGPAVWLIPLLLILAVQFVDSYVLADLYRAEQLTAMQQSFERHDVPEARREQALAQVESGTGFFSSPAFIGLARCVGVVVVGMLLPALLYLVGVNFVLGGRARYGELMAVVCLVALIPLARDILLIPAKRMMETIYVATGPAALIGDKRSVLHYFASLLDFVNLYSLVPLAVGLRAIGQIRAGQAWAVVITVYVLAALVGFGFFMLGQAA